jgi:solute carrier family 7 (L-type amino acid transporter), member 9/15
LAYLFSWTNTLILKPSSIAVLSLTFSQYFLSGIMGGKASRYRQSMLFYPSLSSDCAPTEQLSKLMAIFGICKFSRISRSISCVFSCLSVMLININSISVSAANRLNIIFVVCKVSTIMTVIIAGLVRIAQGLWTISDERKLTEGLF